MNQNKKLYYSILVVAIVALVTAWAWVNIHGTPGTDDGASAIIKSVHPNYTPWIQPLGFRPEKSTETLLFVMQICIGLTILIACILFLKKQHKKLISK